MALNGNSSEKPIYQENKLYTGLTTMKVTAINPTKEEMEAMGRKPQNDPVYITVDQEGVKKLRLDFYLSHKTMNIRTKVSFFLEDRYRTDKEGKKAEWINDFGRSAWGTTEAPPSELKWFDASTARKARIGESDLHSFLINWLNIAPTDEAKLDKFDALFLGNYSELKSLLASYPENEVRVLLTVKEGKYQSVYNRYFDRATNKKILYWESYIKNQTEAGYPPKEDFQNDFALKQWVEPTMMEETASVANEPSAQAGADPF
jgi:hypothetical protein